MERVKQAAQEANQSGPRVVSVGDGQVPQATDSRKVAATMLAAILAAILAHTRRSTDDPLLDGIKPLAFAELDKIAGEHGLSFSDEEREALFALSKAFDPEVAKAAARTACAMFNKEARQ